MMSGKAPVDPAVEMERLEKELTKITQICQQDGSEEDGTVQKLIVANMNILEHIKQLQEAIGTKLSTINQSGLYANTERDNSMIPTMGRGAGDRTAELIRKFTSLIIFFKV